MTITNLHLRVTYTDGSDTTFEGTALEVFAMAGRVAPRIGQIAPSGRTIASAAILTDDQAMAFEDVEPDEEAGYAEMAERQFEQYHGGRFDD